MALTKIISLNKKTINIKKFKIEAKNTTPDYGTISVDKASTRSGDIVTLLVNPVSGYEITNIVTVPEITFFDNYKFRMPAENVKITAGFVKTKNSIITSCSPAVGTLKATPAAANAGETITLTVTPNAGYKFNNYTVTPSTVTITDNKFTMPDSDVTVVANMTAITYTVTCSGDVNGLLTGTETARAGDTVTLIPNAVNDNYKVISYTTTPEVTIKDNKFTMPAQNVTVKATFGLKPYKVNCAVESNGTLSASQEYADEGDSITLYPAGKSGYTFNAYSSTLTITDHVFTMPKSDASITASFKTLTAGTGCYYKYVGYGWSGVLYLRGSAADGYTQYTGGGAILGDEEENAGIGRIEIDSSTTIPLPADCNHMFCYVQLSSGLAGNTLDLNILDTSNVTNMSCMFWEAQGSRSILNIAGWNTSKVTNMFRMFDNAMFTDFILKDWDVSKVTNMEHLFYDSYLIKYLDLENWSPSALTEASGMFEVVKDYGRMTGINLKKFNWAGSCNVKDMFLYQKQLRTIYCNFDWSNKCSNSTSMFAGNSSLIGGIPWVATIVDATYAKPTTGYFTTK